ncbi:MAG: hypothetical protein JNL52_07030 [Flavobacteriales bacterium]|nr:hypothetical protein [Flavobacteriales bacterium]
MEGPGYIGLELPCRRRPPASSLLLVLVDGWPVYTAGPCAGRLCAPRRLVRAVRHLLRAHVQAVRTQADKLALRQPQRAQELLRRAKEWAQAVQRRCLAPHRLRIDGGDRFQAFPLPNAARLQLLRQQTAQAPACVQVVLVVPVTGCMRLLDKVAVHLRAPRRCPRTGRRTRPNGHWQPVPEAHVQAQLVGLHVVVVVS